MKQIIVITAGKEAAEVHNAQQNVLRYLGSRIATLVDEDNAVSPIELDESFSMTDKDFEQVSKLCDEKGCVPLVIYYHENDMASYSACEGLILKVLPRSTKH